ATAPLSLWNDTTITGTVPGSLPTGLKSVVVRRLATGGSVTSNAVDFQVTGMSLNAVTPSSGPIGAPFTITGTQFGAYAGSNTRVRIGGVLAALSLWNDTTITGTIPALPTGVLDIVVERQQGASVALSNISSFNVVALSPTGVAPMTGPIGTAFTLTGSGFGPYAGTNTRVLIGGVSAALSLWNDTTITGSIPALAAGSQPMWIERLSGSGVQSSDTAYFLVTVPEVATVTPSSAPIGAPFTITGTSFGAYAGSNTRVKFNGVAAPLSLWNDTTITGTVPGALVPGEVVLVVERAAGAGLVSSTTQAFLVLAPEISTIAPSFGPAGTVVTLTGSGFGPYSGTLTKVLVGGATVPLSVWNDSTIRWTVPPSLGDGEYPVIVRRSPAGGSVESASTTFTVGTGLGGASFAFAAVQPLAAKPDSHFEGDMSLSSTTGGRIDTPAKAAVDIPANAMDADTEITLKRVRGDGLRAKAADDIKKHAAGEPIEFGPEGTRFNTPVTIELPYDPALARDETKIAIHYYNPLRRAWEELPSVVDRARRVVTAKTDHFSIYQPMGLAPTTAAQDEFYLRDVYAYPNPSRNGEVVVFRIQPGLADTVELRVYDLSGRSIHDSTNFTFRGAIDDGNGKGAQNTYDHTWSVSGIGSGVYTYVIKASRSGQKPITRSGKVGVIR
ncbi:MAG: IPT/TIG domain-containing protein, partial [Elusimicrobiota bacterium]